MAKFRTKLVEIEAFQMTEERRWSNSEWPHWLHEAWQKEPGEGAFWCNPEPPHEEVYLGTLEGVHIVSWGDWIIRGLVGELYPCKPDIFEMKYEAV